MYLVEECTNVTADDEVVVVTDAEKVDVARAINSAARATGATSNIVVKPRLESHGDELPESVGAAMKEADVTADANTDAISHTEARRAASDAGPRHIVLREVTPEMLVDGTVSTDFSEIENVTEAVATIQSDASSVYVSCPNGTDLWADLEGRDSLNKDYTVGKVEPGGSLMIPEGKCGITPIEGTAGGPIVIDYSMDGIGTLSDPIELTVADGRAENVTGGREAEKLRRIMENAGEGARNIAEAASLGTNSHLSLRGMQAVDKKVLGTANFAVGDNRTLGGSVRSDIHLDGVISKPTVEFDGELLVDDGTFQRETASRMAGIEL